MQNPKEDSAGEDRLPPGFLRAMAQNMQAFRAYATLSAPERAAIRRRATDTASQAEMQTLVNRIDTVFPR